VNSRPLRQHVAKLFPQLHGPRTTNVALEQELLTSDAVDGSVVEIQRTRTALGRSVYARWLSFEPGGQVELSLPPSPTVATLDREWRSADLAVRTDCLAAGVQLDAAPVARGRSVAEVPLQLTNERYLRMQQHFDSIGPAGRRMMRLTASTQVCLDWWPGSAGLEQWRLALLTGPFLAATFNRDPGPQSRLAIWLAVDPDRTGFDARLLTGSDPDRTYAAFASDATRFLGTQAQHLTTLFPPVRPRGRYLEVRHLDAQPAAMVGPVAAVLATLLYDDQARRRALRLLEPLACSLADHWHDAAHRPERLADNADELLRLAETALPHGPAGYFPRDVGARLRQFREAPWCVGSPVGAA
jgi:gamma-glutamylcysteine synthetase